MNFRSILARTKPGDVIIRGNNLYQNVNNSWLRNLGPTRDALKVFDSKAWVKTLRRETLRSKNKGLMERKRRATIIYRRAYARVKARYPRKGSKYWVAYANRARDAALRQTRKVHLKKCE